MGGGGDGASALCKPVTAETDCGRWLAAAYSDTTLITQFDGDEPDWKAPQVRYGGEPTWVQIF